MSISEIKTPSAADKNLCYFRRRHTSDALISFAFAFLLILYGAVYEYFSHGVWSYYTVYAFVPALVCGLYHFIRLALNPKRYFVLTAALFHSSVSCLTVGSAFTGVLEIYGTSSPLIPVFFIAGAIFALAGIIAAILRR